VLRWMRKGRPFVVLAWVGFIFWFLVSKTPSRVPGLKNVAQQLNQMENRSLDLRFRWRGPEPGQPDILILAIDRPILSADEVSAKSLAASPALQAMTEGYQESWRHVVWAEAIERLMKFGAKVVVFDIIFSRKATDVERVERLLRRLKEEGVPAMSGEERLLALAAADSKRFRGMVDQFTPKLVLGMAYDVNGQIVQLRLPHPTLAPEDFENLLGNVTIPFDSESEQVQRHITHRIEDKELVLDLKGMDALAVEKFNGTKAPQTSNLPIRFQGGRGTYPTLPLAALFDDEQLAQGPFRGGEIFRDRIVYIGATYELAHDDKTTPFGVMPGVEVHANVAGDLLTGSRLRHVSDRVEWWIKLATLGLPAVLVLYWRRALAQIIAIFVLIAGYVAACHFAFSRWDIILPMVVGLFAPVTVGGFGIVYSFVLEQREKAHIRKVFNQFVSARIAGVVLKNSEEFEQARRGEKRPVAILFSDIRSFTTWSEKAAPEHLVGQLNEYFERMVGHISEGEGNVQKFIGDAILAAWGDTHSNGHGEDCRRAVASVLKMRATLRELNAQWDARPDRITINIGMGINHGEVVVGEVGHPERREYTVLGDGVNFAARLESATKQFHTDCLIGESVEALTREHFVYRHADFVRVKGKTKPVNIFFPLSDRSVPPPEWLADYHRARSLFLERKFEEAAEVFREVKARIGKEDFLCDLYLTLCYRYVVEPPAADWDGSRVLTEK
jgi:adenylate cyclase